MITPATTLATADQPGLVHAPCPVCGQDRAEPVAVGSDMAHRSGNETFLAVRCVDCGLIRLDPRPEESTRRWSRSPGRDDAPGSTGGAGARSARAAARLAGRWGRALPRDARLLELGYAERLHLDELQRVGAPTWMLEAVTPHDKLALQSRRNGSTVHLGGPDAALEPRQPYDAILLLHALEHLEDPRGELVRARALLRPGGSLFVLTVNTDSTVARLFRGRHWAGYDFPRHVTLFDDRVLRRVAEDAGFQVERIVTRARPEMWVQSAINLLQDWSPLSWLVVPARRGSALLSGLAVLVESAARLGGKAAWLEAVLRAPAGGGE